MAMKLYEESNIQAIADAIRAKNGEDTKYKPSEMAAAISAITTGGNSGSDSSLPFGEFFSVALPTKEKLLSLGYTLHEFTLISIPTGVWALPNPLGEKPKEIIALFRVDENVSEIVNTDYPIYAVNTEFVNGSYTNHNTFSIKEPPNMPTARHYQFSYNSYRWLAALPDAEKITLRSPADNVSVRWQPGDYILAVK